MEETQATLPIEVKILNTKTKEIAVYDDVLYWWGDLGDSDWSLFMWTDGNFSCDCNRGLFFGRAANREDKFDNIECNSGDNVFLVEIKNKLTGEIMYSEVTK